MKKICQKFKLNIFNFMPLTFVYNLDCPKFFENIDHFFRFFKALKIFNFLAKKSKKMVLSSENKNKEKLDLKNLFKSSVIDNHSKNDCIKPIISLKQKEKNNQQIWKLINIKNQDQFCLGSFQKEILNKMHHYQKLYLKSTSQQKGSKGQKAKQIEGNVQKIRTQYKKKTILTKIFRILKQPSKKINDNIYKFINSIIQESDIKEFKSQRKSLYKDRFYCKLFNEEKPLVKFPGTDSEWNIYYSNMIGRSFNKGVNLWLLKVSQYNRGFGIELFKTLESFYFHLVNFKNGYEENIKLVSKKKTKQAEIEETKNKDSEAQSPREKKVIKRSHMKIQSKRFVIQKYIEDPLLINDRKFDIRLWIMIGHDHKLYTCREMYIRVSSHAFDLNNLEKFGHLNNIALQKYSKDYDQENAVITIESLERKIREFVDPEFDFEKLIRPKLNKIIGLLGFSFLEKIKTTHSWQNYFEIFGLDFMIDADFKVWFIEVNSNPAITTGNYFLDHLIPRMLDDAFKLTLDKVFPVPKRGNCFLKKIKPEKAKKILNTYSQTVFPLDKWDNKENIC